MPLYDYKCKDHGVFYGLQTMDKYDQPVPCPECGQLSARIIRIAPEILTMAKEKKTAHETNERAQHEPITSSSEQRKHDHQHQKQCGCHKEKSSKLFYTAQGEKMFPSMRPWMISH